MSALEVSTRCESPQQVALSSSKALGKTSTQVNTVKRKRSSKKSFNRARIAPKINPQKRRSGTLPKKTIRAMLGVERTPSVLNALQIARLASFLTKVITLSALKVTTHSLLSAPI